MTEEAFPPEWLSKIRSEMEDEFRDIIDRHPVLRYATAIDKRNIAYVLSHDIIGELTPESVAAMSSHRAARG